ncbi:MAG: hypothetical protein B5M56_00895 [Desulfococcus sp. 4484_241]|nr:MAG: hypothetical protein B5M56_00895 [Desulfococcus sp. 4484_241]
MWSWGWCESAGGQDELVLDNAAFSLPGLSFVKRRCMPDTGWPGSVRPCAAFLPFCQKDINCLSSSTNGLFSHADKFLQIKRTRRRDVDKICRFG